MDMTTAVTAGMRTSLSAKAFPVKMDISDVTTPTDLDAFTHGGYVMVKMIAVTAGTRHPRSATKAYPVVQEWSGVMTPTGRDVFPKDGAVTEKMIAKTAGTRGTAPPPPADEWDHIWRLCRDDTCVAGCSA